MKSKDRVLALLREEPNRFRSGSEIAKALGISRNAVWKAIEGLRKDGLSIEAVTNRGYRLTGGRDLLAEEQIRERIQERAEALQLNDPLELAFHLYATIDSTNRRAKELALQGAPQGTVVLADSQTEGSGRHARSFYSPSGGIYLSVILRPETFPFTEPRVVTAYAAVCTAMAIEETTGLAPVIKPVNDLYLNGKKICGILTESVSDFESGEVQWIVAGIGINMQLPEAELPEELQDKAGALYGAGEAGISRNVLIAELLLRILCLEIGRSREEILQAYEQRVKSIPHREEIL